MPRKEVFLDIKDVQQRTEALNGYTPQYGTKEVVFAAAAESKSGRKVQEATRRLTSTEIFSDIEIGTEALQHTSYDKKGKPIADPTFIEIRGENRNWFVTTRLFSSDGEGTIQTNSNFSPEVTPLPAGTPEDPIRVITGACLFGASSAEAKTVDGKTFSLTDPVSLSAVDQPIESMDIDDWLHPYEAEASVRLPQFIGETFSNKAVTVTAHIPQVEYYLYGLSLHERGIMSREQLDTWMDHVDQRTQGVERLLQNRLHPDHTLEVVKPLAAIQEDIRKGDDYDLQAMTEKLRAADPLWDAFLSKEGNQPESFTDLGYMSYTHAYLDSAQQGFVVAVENPEEQRIFLEAQRNIDVIGEKPAAIAAMYVHPNVLAKRGIVDANGNEKKFLYYHPNHDQRKLQALREVLHAYRTNGVNSNGNGHETTE